jgi:tetratricopeptide (TPR) repeat protein
MDDSELAHRQQAGAADSDIVATRLAFLRELVAAERWQDAEEAGASLLNSQTPSAVVYGLMGIVYGKRQRVEEAIIQCRQALALQPDAAVTLLNLGILLTQQGDMPAALEPLTKVIAVQKGWAEAHYTFGTVLLQQQRYTEAIRAFEDALDCRSTYPEAHFNRGNAHAMKGLDTDGTLDYYELDCAINAYKAAIQQQPGYTAALYNLGMLYKRMGSSEGLRVWEQYLEAARNVPEEASWLVRAEEYTRDLQDRLR